MFVVAEVKTLFKGMVAVKEQAVNEARSKEWDLKIVHDGQAMLIPCDKIVERMVRKSDEYEDQFGRGNYRLWYFNWQPGYKDPDQLGLWERNKANLKEAMKILDK